MSAGRPTDYSPEVCEQVINWGRQGKSLTWMAARLEVHRDTLYEWRRVHKEFSDALTLARLHSQAWWEDLAQNNIWLPAQGGIFNAAAWSKNMACRFQDEWRDKSETNHSGSLEITAITRNIVDARNASND